MGAPVTKGTVYYYDGTETNVVIGTRERLKAERQHGKRGMFDKPEEYLAYIAFEALKREGLSNIGFDAWAETVAAVEFDDENEELVGVVCGLLDAVDAAGDDNIPEGVNGPAKALRDYMETNHGPAVQARKSDAEGESPTPHS